MNLFAAEARRGAVQVAVPPRRTLFLPAVNLLGSTWANLKRPTRKALLTRTVDACRCHRTPSEDIMPRRLRRRSSNREAAQPALDTNLLVTSGIETGAIHDATLLLFPERNTTYCGMCYHQRQACPACGRFAYHARCRLSRARSYVNPRWLVYDAFGR